MRQTSRSYGSRTPSLPANPRSSSVESSHPKSIEALEKCEAKVLKHINSLISKVQRDVRKLFTYQRQAYEDLTMTQETITRIRAVTPFGSDNWTFASKCLFLFLGGAALKISSVKTLFFWSGCVATNHNVLTLQSRYERVWVIVDPNDS